MGISRLGVVKFSLLLSYRGLPKSWETGNIAELPAATQMKLEKASKTIKETQKGGLVYVQGDPSLLLNSLWEQGDIQDFKGLDFPKYFSDKMDKDRTAPYLVPQRYTFIYNVGSEAAINKKFSGQLLKQLAVECRDAEVWCFLCGDITKTNFTQEYGIDVYNSITLPKAQETKLF